MNRTKITLETLGGCLVKKLQKRKAYLLGRQDELEDIIVMVNEYIQSMDL